MSLASNPKLSEELHYKVPIDEYYPLPATQPGDSLPPVNYRRATQRCGYAACSPLDMARNE
jgi:hypothetical protein